MPKRADGVWGGGSRAWVRWLWLGHALYYLITGIWPLIGPRSFQAVTGPKVDFWLAQTVGVLTTVIGAVIAAAGLRRRVSAEVVGLAAGASAGLAAIDVVFVARKRIRKIYLMDALLSGLLCAGWIFAWRRKEVPQQR